MCLTCAGSAGSGSRRERPLQTLQSSPSDVGAARRSSLALAAALGLVAVLLTGALLLWANYGTAVFFEMIAAGIAACF
jgi:hypothetical protein